MRFHYTEACFSSGHRAGLINGPVQAKSSFWRQPIQATRSGALRASLTALTRGPSPPKLYRSAILNRSRLLATLAGKCDEF
ncbi:MAG: hypothetical protein ACI841_003483 [Planctomycetota bacterium]|jgi:hypothetical protein